jgi:Ca-activated chloride channel homolog
MTFAWPLALLGLFLLPLGALALYAVSRRRSRYPVWFPNLEVLADASRRTSRWRRTIPPILFALGAGVLFVALGRPHATVTVPRQEATVVIVMDTSGSMLAADVAPSRLEAAQASARQFVELVPPTFRLAVLAFSDVADVLRPPTTNHGAVVRVLEGLTAGGGTAMGDALGKALGLTGVRTRVEQSTPRPAGARPLFTVLLLSDGRSNRGDLDPLDAATQAETLRVPVFTIALGSEDAEPAEISAIPVEPPDRRTLRAIAQNTGGEFFSAPTERDLENVYRELSERIGHVRRRREITSSFAGLAAVLLGGAGAASLLWRSRFP